MAGTRYVTPSSLDPGLRAWLADADAHTRPRALPALEKSALLLVDVQRYFSAPESHAYLPALEAVLPRMASLCQSFRRAGRPVIFTRHLDHPDAPTLMQSWWRGTLTEGPLAPLAEPLSTFEPDLLLEKSSYSAFQGTSLAAWLRARGVESLVVAGVMTHLCVEMSARHAFVLGFTPIVPADATAANEESHHASALRNLAHGFAHVCSAAAIEAALSAREIGSRPRVAAPLPVRVELLVVGAGPAGVSAAIQAKRAGIDVLLCAPAGAGGQLMVAERVENYPGFPGGISGRRLAQRMASQLEAEEVNTCAHAVRAIESVDGRWRAQLDDGAQVTAEAVIVATGAAPASLPQIDAGIATPYLHEGLALRGQRVALVGGGEAAFDQALLACRCHAREVTIVMRSHPEVLPRLIERAEALGVKRLQGVQVRQATADGATILLALDDGTQLEVDRLVLCVGKTSRLPRLPDTLERREDGPLQTDEVGCTSAEGLYVVGDARRGRYRQVGIAVGDGLAAAMAAARWLKDREQKGSR